jgi:hypothetical protein
MWWTPGRQATEVLNSNITAMSADLSARQYAGRPTVEGPHEMRVASIPSRDTPSWATQVHEVFGVWSPDDLLIATLGGEEDFVDRYLVRRAADGARQLLVLVEGVPEITWENSSAVLILTRSTGSSRPYQLIR